MSEQIFLVIGTTGEYSDRDEWYVAAYRDRAKAESHALLAKAEGATLKRGDKNAYDKDFQKDYTGTDYYVAEVLLCEDVPKVVAHD